MEIKIKEIEKNEVETEIICKEKKLKNTNTIFKTKHSSIKSKIIEIENKK